LIYSDIDFG